MENYECNNCNHKGSDPVEVTTTYSKYYGVESQPGKDRKYHYLTCRKCGSEDIALIYGDEVSRR